MSNLDAKLQFQAEQLAWFRDELNTSLNRELEKYRIGVTDELKDSINTYATQEAAGMTMLKTGRFVDLGAGRGYKGKLTRKDRAQIRKLNAGKRIRKPKPFYNNTVWGLSFRLISRLTHLYVEAATATIKEPLAKK